MRTVAHLYDTYEHATTVVKELEATGFSHDDVSIVANQGAADGYAAPAAVDPVKADAAETGAGTGASIGTILGGGAGLLAGIGALAIPGVGPVIAAGWLVATLTGAGAGAAAGGLLGSLTGAGVPDDNAHVYTEGVRRGSTLVTVRADDARAAEAETIMARHNPVDVAQRGADYRSGKWERFDEAAGTMTPEELAGRAGPGDDVGRRDLTLGDGRAGIDCAPLLRCYMTAEGRRFQ